jgi:hypothetical protein
LKLSLHELEAIPGIGKKRAGTIVIKQPKTEADWQAIFPPDIYPKIKILFGI